MCAAVAYCSVPNITHMWSAYASRDRFHIIMEYCQGGNMLDWLKAQQPHAMPEQWLAMQVGYCAVGLGCSRKGPGGGGSPAGGSCQLLCAAQQRTHSESM